MGAGANVMAVFTSAGAFYNATGYLGVRFWAKTSRDYTLRIDVSTRGTTDAQDGGLCNPGPSRPCVPYGVRKPLVAAMDWQLVTVQWNEPRGLDANGVPPPTPLDPTSVKYVRFDFEPINVSFDVWIDDLTFF